MASFGGSQVVRVQFTLRADLDFGEAPFAVGGIVQLGNVHDIGNPGSGAKACGLPLYTSSKDYPLWKSRVVELPAESDISYGYIVHQGGRFHRWEDVAPTRVLKLAVVRQQAKAVVILDDFGKGQTQPEKVETLPGPDVDLRRLTSDATEPGVEPGPAGQPLGPRPRPQTDAPAEFVRSLGQTDAVQINSADGVVVVSYRLPVKVRREPSLPSGWAVRWDYDHLLSLRTTQLRVTRVGMVDLGPEEGILSAHDQANLERALLPFDCVPVFVSPEQEKGLDIFWQQTLLPTFHHLMDLYCSDSSRWTHFLRERSAWNHYTSVNNRYRRKVVEVFNEGDMVWIHDLQLMMLPSYLIRQLKVARVGFFLHAPFPSSEIFRSLWCRTDLLHGMLNADLIGFHLYEYARHFLTCCRRLLGLTHTMDSRGTINLDYNGRTVSVVCVHAGIEPPVLVRTLRRIETEGQIVKNSDGRMKILSIDELSRLSGLRVKLLAFEEFLRRNPHLSQRVVLHQRVIVGGTHAHELRIEDTRATAMSMLARIQRMFGEKVVVYEEVTQEDATLESRMPLLAAADMYLVTSLRGGLNRVALEYTFVQHATRWNEQTDATELASTTSESRGGPLDLGVKPGEGMGLVISSEFVSCTRILQGAIRVNPWRFDELVDALEKAVGMSESERVTRHLKDWYFVSRNTSVQWAHRVLLDLKGIHKSTARSQYSVMGLGHNFRVLGMQAGFTSLDITEVVRAYRKAESRVIFLDYGGTLVEDQSNDDAVRHFAMVAGLEAQPAPERLVLNMLEKLCGDRRNTIFIVSGREHKGFMNSAVAKVENLGIAAEHGYIYRYPSRLSSGSGNNLANIENLAGAGDWNYLLPNFDMSWTTLVKRIMDVYVQRTNGTYVEVKGCALLWQYRDADPEFGEVQSKELEDHLISAVKNFPVVVLRGESTGREKKGGYIEVRPTGVSKGIFVTHILNHLRDVAARSSAAGPSMKEPDFVLCIGDDSSDEFMYKAATDYARMLRAGQGAAGVQPPSIFTCTVGKKPTAAAGYVNSVGDVHALLNSLIRSNNSRYFSTPNLSAMPSGRRAPLSSLGGVSETVEPPADGSPTIIVNGAEGRESHVPPRPSEPSRQPVPTRSPNPASDADSDDRLKESQEAPPILASSRTPTIARGNPIPRSFSMSSIGNQASTPGFVSMKTHFQSIHEEEPDGDDSDEGNFF